MYIVDVNSDILCPPPGCTPSILNTQSVTKVQEYVIRAAVVGLRVLVLFLIAQSLGVSFDLKLYSLLSRETNC